MAKKNVRKAGAASGSSFFQSRAKKDAELNRSDGSVDILPEDTMLCVVRIKSNIATVKTIDAPVRRGTMDASQLKDTSGPICT